MLSRLGALRESSESLVTMGCSQLTGSVLHKKLDSRSKAVEFVPVRCGAPRFKPNIAKTKPLKSPTMLALDHFDFYYAPLFDKRWPSVRLGLLTPNKFVATVNRFSKDFEMSQRVLRNIGTIDLMESVRKMAQESNFNLKPGVLGSEAISSEEEIDEPDNVDDEIYEFEHDEAGVRYYNP
ncbi:5-methylcytosine rRNA methyltransferase NSUN4 [Ditylenchus destructor]|nr:5-methylcytosine rRNA methyltransferase NSUN4 [Ditylenchus destructor]